jgi:EAL domain-containing protein (putative c-di-GMP-specific phosphodiesterase class I)/GGDEF domain-containing protein
MQGFAPSAASSFVMSLGIGEKPMRFLHDAERMGLQPVFQPVVALASAAVTGHELLTQPFGRADRQAAAMFTAAAGAGASVALAIRCIEIGIDGFRRAQGRSRLFVKLPPAGAVMLAGTLDGFVDWLREGGLPADRVVIELMEYEAADAASDVESAVVRLRNRGFGIALNSLGAGIGTTRLWLDLQPEYVKLDGYFTQGICRDSRRVRFVESMLRVAGQLGTTLIAHALETEADLRVVRDLGVPLAQGFVIARPAPDVRAQLDDEARARVCAGGLAVLPERANARANAGTAERLLARVPPVSVHTRVGEILERFESRPRMQALAVVADDRPVGTISREAVLGGAARMLDADAFRQRTAAEVMRPDPVTIDRHMTIPEIGALIADPDGGGDPLIVVEAGRYVGLAHTGDLVREMTQLHSDAARYANPLTGLPGEVPVARHAGRLLAARAPFAACWCGLVAFRGYNERYGYDRGDQMIKLVARVLSAAAQEDADFVAHLGGDRFVLLLQGDGAQTRVREALSLFAANVEGLFDREDLARGRIELRGRRGEVRTSPLTTLAIGMVEVPAGADAGYVQIAAAAAQARAEAVKAGGSALFVERRRLFDR